MKNTPRKSSKRTHTLKQILERQKVDTTMVNLLEINEDLPFKKDGATSIAKTVHFSSAQSSVPASTPSDLSKTIDLFNGLINKKINSAAKLLKIDEGELKAWIDLQILVPAKTIVNLLRTIQNLHLDPLNEEIGLAQYEDGNWQVFITIEGCSRLLNQHAQFNGVLFNQADNLVEGIPEWIECSIYRRDRIIPITVREYLIEVRSETEIWQKMPRRMLRHRALQQCVRLAVG